MTDAGMTNAGPSARYMSCCDVQIATTVSVDNEAVSDL